MAEQDPTLAGKKFSELVKKMGNVTAWVSDAVAGMNRDQSVSNLVKTIKRLAREGLEARAGVRGYVPGPAGARAARVGPGLSSLKTYLTQRGEAVRAQFERFEKHAKLSAMGDRFKAVGGQIVTTREQASGLAGLTGQGLSALSGALASTGKSALRASADFETYKAVLTTIMGEDKAKTSMTWIDEFTRKTPFKLAGVTQAFMTLKGEGIDPMDGTLQALGDAAAATGKPLNDLAEAFADGAGGDWKGLKKLGITLKKTQGDMMSMTYTDKSGREQTIEAAKKDSEAMQAAILHVLKAKGFGGTLDALSQTWDGMWSSLQHSLSGFLRMIGDAGAFESLKGKLRSILELIARWKADGTLQAWANRISDSLKTLFDFIEAKLTGVDWGNLFTTATTAVSDFVGWVQRAVAYVGGWENAVLILVAALNANLLLSLVGLVGQFAALVPLMARVIVAVASLNPVLALIGSLAMAVYLIYEHWGNLPAFFASVLNAIAPMAQGVMDALRTALEGASSWLSDFCDGVRAAFEEGFINGIIHVVDRMTLRPYLAKIAQEALLFLTGIDLYAIGAELIQDLWGGIKAKWAELESWLTDKLKSLTDWIPDVAKDKLGITAPSGTLTVPPANENRSAVERVAASGSKALAAGLMAATLAAGPVAASPTVAKAASSALPAVENAGKIPGAALAVPGGAGAPFLSLSPSPIAPSPIAPSPPGSPPGPSSGNVVNAPVNVSITVNGMAELDALRRETESAVRFALAEWTSRQQADAEASLFDQWA
ncbi:hypothetical protein [Azospirillum agricola]|uniref:hypothetical protein n=1 Tax=Azospirillum agricola TaxID=1720247 RepID=UPI000A0F00B0|nr:hypothetical protein [Azospirillum agricola]SMH59494.1 hypothetical protein SAMN02982994_5080 [Azospirillum lipoferum]